MNRVKKLHHCTAPPPPPNRFGGINRVKQAKVDNLGYHLSTRFAYVRNAEKNKLQKKKKKHIILYYKS